jgi:hypothetical protein
VGFQVPVLIAPEVIKRLDEINEHSPAPSGKLIKELTDLLDEFANGLEELKTLVDRYGKSQSTVLTQALASCSRSMQHRHRGPIAKESKNDLALRGALLLLSALQKGG